MWSQSGKIETPGQYKARTKRLSNMENGEADATATTADSKPGPVSIMSADRANGAAVDKRASKPKRGRPSGSKNVAKKQQQLDKALATSH